MPAKKEGHVKAKARPQTPGTKDDRSRQDDPNQPGWYRIHPGWRSRPLNGLALTATLIAIWFRISNCIKRRVADHPDLSKVRTAVSL